MNCWKFGKQIDYLDMFQRISNSGNFINFVDINV